MCLSQFTLIDIAVVQYIFALIFLPAFGSARDHIAVSDICTNIEGRSVIVILSQRLEGGGGLSLAYTQPTSTSTLISTSTLKLTLDCKQD